MDRLYTVKEMANYLGYSEPTIRKWIVAKKIEAFNFSKSRRCGYRIPESELRRILKLKQYVK